jgi:glycosyltransferase involved in cell wall biosynthesis
MSKQSRKAPTKRAAAKRPSGKSTEARISAAQALVAASQHAAALGEYEELLTRRIGTRLHGIALNDLAVVHALMGDNTAAREHLAAALDIDDDCASARKNIEFLEADSLSLRNGKADEVDCFRPADSAPASSPACRVAILSFLFNWPSTGGGIIHTVELAKFLGLAGYQVKHFFARRPDWGIGKVDAALPIDTEALDFDCQNWTAERIKAAYRAAVDRFDPDYVIITDSWNFKPLLAEAMGGYPYIFRQQALELLCPLNNLRLLFGANGSTQQCPLHQLATPDRCQQCVSEHGHLAGGLHRAERELAGVGTPEYDKLLRRTLAEAEAVLVLNPLLESMLSPYANNVRVATWGMDASRFPWPWHAEPPRYAPDNVLTLMMAGVVQEAIKGFHVLQQACEKLWQHRHDFLLVATGEPAGQVNAFTRFIGWISQEELPSQIRAADVLVVPTIAQEGLSRTSVEAMGVGRPVVASRIGGLPFTVSDGATGLLCEPGDPVDLARKLELLLDDPSLRQRLGAEGRRRFEQEFTWERVIERSYRPILNRRRSRS